MDVGISNPVPLQKIPPKKSPYFEKNNLHPILTIEDEYLNKDPWKIVSIFFPK